MLWGGVVEFFHATRVQIKAIKLQVEISGEDMGQIRQAIAG